MNHILCLQHVLDTHSVILKRQSVENAVFRTLKRMELLTGRVNKSQFYKPNVTFQWVASFKWARHDKI